MASTAAVPCDDAVLAGADDFEKLKNLCLRTYSQQAVWFLNAYWKTVGQTDAENIWKYVQKYIEIDVDNRDKGCSIDELCAHRFLEAFDETMTVRAMRTELRKSGAIGEKFRDIPITHYLILKYKVDWHELVHAVQGDNVEEIREASRLLEAAQAAADAAQQREKEARVAAAEAKQTEIAAHAAKEELDAALAELKAQEDAYNAKTAELTKKSEEGGVVSRNRAKNELAQHLAEDPLPLRRAKITMEAAVKKADRTRAAATAAREASEAAAAAAEAATQEALMKVAEAEAYLEEMKKKPGSAEGQMWWLERRVIEAKKYMPTSKGGIAK